ncbi:hypothetical protein [Nostoc sp.]|uniref:hypothetical protein n=1 Tax=Nostoc sp. TaxID=1180 RepID=UPI002FF975ED
MVSSWVWLKNPLCDERSTLWLYKMVFTIAMPYDKPLCVYARTLREFSTHLCMQYIDLSPKRRSHCVGRLCRLVPKLARASSTGEARGIKSFEAYSPTLAGKGVGVRSVFDSTQKRYSS